MIHIFHHNDPDGWCSAAVVLKALREKAGGAPLRHCLHEMNYGRAFPWGLVGLDDQVYMVDYSLQPRDMMALAAQCSALTWCDHHKSSLEAMDAAYPDWRLAIGGMCAVGVGACELAWRHFFPAAPLPVAVRLVSMYDVWRLDEEPDALPFQYGLRAHSTVGYPSGVLWTMLLGEGPGKEPTVGGLPAELPLITGRTLRDGRIIQPYQDRVNREICARAAFDTELMAGGKSYKAIACTSPLCSSLLFDSVWDCDKYDIMLSFYRDNGGHWTVSVYTDKPGVDCAAIAGALRGGGHLRAAGFQCAELPFMHNGVRL